MHDKHREVHAALYRWLISFAIAPEVHSHALKIVLKVLQLVSPAVPHLWKAMKHEHQWLAGVCASYHCVEPAWNVQLAWFFPQTDKSSRVAFTEDFLANSNSDHLITARLVDLLTAGLVEPLEFNTGQAVNCSSGGTPLVPGAATVFRASLNRCRGRQASCAVQLSRALHTEP